MAGSAPLPGTPHAQQPRRLRPEERATRERRSRALLSPAVAVDGPGKCQGAAEERPDRERGERGRGAAAAPRSPRRRQRPPSRCQGVAEPDRR